MKTALKPEDQSQRWLHTQTLRAAPAQVDADRGVIEGASVCSMGEAKGHGYHLDESFVDEVVKQGNASKQGLKVRFGHPNMCNTALGTFLGRAKKFAKVVKGGVPIAVADVFLSNSAKETPHGDLHNYTTQLAETEADMFGMSIVFDPGRAYKKNPDGTRAYRHVRHGWENTEVWYTTEAGDRLSKEEEEELTEETFLELEKLRAADMVDDPAANEGLFSQASVAGQVTEFLDQHPEVVQALSTDSNVLKALASHPEQVQGFMVSYLDNNPEGKQEMLKLFKTEATDKPATEALEDQAPLAPEEETEGEGTTTEAGEEEQSEEAQATESDQGEEGNQATESDQGATEGAESPTEEDETTSTEEPTTEEQEAQPDDSRQEFSRMVEDFGPEVAATVFAQGGGHQEAMLLDYEQTKKENETLKKQLGTAAGEATGATPQVNDDKPARGSLFSTSK